MNAFAGDGYSAGADERSRNSWSTEQLLLEILDASRQLTGADGGAIQAVGPAARPLQIAVRDGVDATAFCEWLTAANDRLERSAGVIIADVSSAVFGDAELRQALLNAGVRALHAKPLVDQTGRVVGVLATYGGAPHRATNRELRLFDVLAHQAAALLEWTQREQAFKDTDRRKDEFLATLAHELRAPLAPINNAVRCVRLAAGDMGGITTPCNVIERQLEQLRRLVEDLLDTARIGRGDVNMHMGRIALAAVVELAVETSRSLIEREAHELRIEVPARPIYVEGDLGRLVQVVTNLLNNSAKYSQPGGRITVSVAQQGDCAILSITDQGVGITREMLARVFEPFTQASQGPARSTDGLGIGLTVVRRLVQLHGGTVELRSEGPGTGAQVIVRLPLAPLDANGPQRRSLRVLVADENRGSTAGVAATLEANGYEVCAACDSRDVLAIADAFCPEVVLVDIRMPRLDGYGTARQLRARPWAEGLVLVALTDWEQAEDQSRVRAAGFDCHLVKPVDLAALRQLLPERLRPATTETAKTS